MAGLFADGWFYISSAGLLVSGLLFFFLLGQYRAASEAADLDEDVETAEPEHASDHAVKPVFVREEPKQAAAVASVSEPSPAPAPATPKTEDYSGPERRKDPATTTGGISPAVVYLQNIKAALADLHGEVRTLSKRVDDELASVASRDEALIERLAELTRTVEALKVSAPAPAAAAPAPEPVPTPAPKKKKPAPAPVVEEAPEPKIEPSSPQPKTDPIVVEAPPTPVTEPAKPAPSPDETVRMELGAVIEAQLSAKTPPPAEAAPEPAPAEPAPEPEPEKPRRGPVWPV